MLLSLIALVGSAPLPPAVSPPPVETAVDGLPVLVAAVLAAGLTRLWGARRAADPPRVVRLGRGVGFRPFGAPLPGTGDGPSVWRVPPEDVDAFVLGLAARLAERGPVLLLPRADRRAAAWERFGAGPLPVWMPEEERPSARRALAAAGPLSDGRPPALVLAGVGALEPVVGGRPAAALEELLAGSGLAAFVVVGEGEAAPTGPWPVVNVTRDRDTWIADGVRLGVVDGTLARVDG